MQDLLDNEAMSRAKIRSIIQLSKTRTVALLKTLKVEGKKAAIGNGNTLKYILKPNP